ncbi:uncharacterized protein LOC122147786 [Cyprinus carpio]|uniref:Uncharacterized protein LOC122147786 n=1 Tax=Cyprinus carpio TaxID=7962 RepID=A0A9Q9YWF1_CYPCA|nr:uncharacterized protein LOC122147786 [Cyprinus carpio]
MWIYMSGKILLLLSSAPLPCPVSFILQDKEATSHNDCSPCPPSRYCIAPGPSQPSGFCSPGHYCISGADTAAPQATPSQQTCFCDLIPSSHFRKYDLCFLKHNIACSIHILGDGAKDWTNLDPRPLLDLTESEGYSESPLQITETCTGFKGDLCPTGECSAGYYYDWGSSSLEQSLCPSGFYCPAGPHKPLACTASTYSSVMGKSHQGNC